MNDDDREMTEDRCEVCGTLVGIGIRAFHLGRCDDHPRETAMHLTQANFDDLHLRCSTYAAEVSRLTARLQELEPELTQQRAVNLELVNGKTIAWEIEHDRALEAEREVARLKVALHESVKLQSHYADLLNMHDGGKRIGFADADAWIARLRETGTLT